ncbi:hypothetical protein LOD99_11525 [Oopsacas minuta]|uniref:protein-tyrosine-phosphatase n=1 Tax=Oopsacas minuta TaxID=111878 RepID=A0AAV7JJP9_9METZ|nr:hypothetical protein LOD99_11525 [Oopsacas minuta]
MDLRICLFVIVVFVVLQRCYTDTIDVEFPSVAPQNFEYILDIDPVNREYNCIDRHSTNETHKSSNVYSVYTNTKTIGIKKFTCYNQNTYLGTTDIEVKEGGHIEVILDNIPINYTTNQVLEVVENTNNLVITCSADTGELISGGVAQSYPSVIIPTVTSQHDNNVYTCRRIIGGEILFEVSLTLMVPVSSTTQGVTSIPSVTSTTSGTIQSSSSTMVDATEPTNTTRTIADPTTTAETTTTPTTGTTTPEIITTTTVTTPTTRTITDPTTTAETPTTTTTTSVTTTPEIITTTTVTTPTTTTITDPTTTDRTTTTKTTPNTTPTIATTTTTTTTTTTITTESKTTTEPQTGLTADLTSTSTSSGQTKIPITTSQLPLHIIALPAALGLIAVLCCLLGIIFLFVCCCFLCSKRGKMSQLQKLDNELYTENGTSSLEKLPSEEMLIDPMPPFICESEVIFSLDIVQSEFKDRVNELWEKEEDQLIQEYNSLGGIEMRYPADIAVSPAAEGKNRYRNILPYDRSRVALKVDPREPGTGYINASHIPGILTSQNFISSQGPKENTVNDFWEMLWENQVKHLVMLTRLLEGNKKKCEKYWPDKVGDGEHRGQFFVTLVNLVTEKMWVTRELMVRNEDGDKHLVKQFQFIGWPDFGAPRFPQDLILFIRKVKLETGTDTSTICVHCSAGVGRSGTFIALYNMLGPIAAGRNLSIFKVVNEMREYRTQMVQSWLQYRFIYLTVLELIHGDTSIHMNNFHGFYQSRMLTHSPVFTTQFHELDYQTEKSFTRTIERAFEVDVINPDTSVLPYDDCRVVLTAPYWDGSDYINASYVDGYDSYATFIATQLPVSDSVRDLMQLIYQTKSPVVVLLASYLEFEDMKYDEGRIKYWPDPMTQHEFSGYTLMNENTFIHPLINRLKLVNVAFAEAHEFTLVTLLDWTKAGEFGTTIDCMQRLLQVAQLIEKCQEQKPIRPIIIHCKDGSGATGVLITALISIRQIKCENNVDIFQVAKRIRYNRQYMINSLEQYISVHFIISSYLRELSEDPPTPTAPYLSSL